MKQKIKEIAKGWSLTGATTISAEDVRILDEEAPSFGVLQEDGGSKIYAFFGNKEIRKDVICNKNELKFLISEIKKLGFPVKKLKRKWLGSRKISTGFCIRCFIYYSDFLGI